MHRSTNGKGTIDSLNTGWVMTVVMTWLHRLLHHINSSVLVKPGARGLRARAWFLEIALVCALVCMCVCVSAPEGINNQWHDIGHVRLVK